MVTDDMMAGRTWHRKQGPFFRVEELAKIFFGMSSSWLRLKLNPDPDHPLTWFVTEDGTRMEFRRRDPENSASARVFWLSDVEPMLWSLREFGAIDSARVVLVLRVVEAVARLYGLFDCEPDVPPAS
ncbi:MAG: hypothetical protein JWM19_849 [Actinomycetia bacterium]|nr:hypothetical protein [Actinomycetes bacterium]